MEVCFQEVGKTEDDGVCDAEVDRNNDWDCVIDLMNMLNMMMAISVMIKGALMVIRDRIVKS